ncbi:MAG TPA: PD-(D/E)XK nuclease family protein [Anaerolineae bacterium]|nr:PD-(D/E)XK nuclease family protein [Anaerolineae bacterium]HXW01462.1 PD-(D/E)XK nuclease family protein [Anaerolineae bacterium]
MDPIEARTLAHCSLHYYFLQQTAVSDEPAQLALDQLVRETIQELHAAGGPARLSLEQCLAKVAAQPLAQPMIERYYRRLSHDWPHMIAGNETLELRISIGGIPVLLSGTLDRLDKTSDGGILAILFRTEPGPLPSPAELRQDHALTIYHALVAANYPHKRPIRLQELWLQLDQDVTIELSEEEYRNNLGHLREPIQILARGQVRARPGLHCETCPFKYRGCPVYAHEQNEADDLASPPSAGNIPPRQWTFKI